MKKLKEREIINQVKDLKRITITEDIYEPKVDNSDIDPTDVGDIDL